MSLPETVKFNLDVPMVKQCPMCKGNAIYVGMVGQWCCGEDLCMYRFPEYAQTGSISLEKKYKKSAASD
eukprot:g536.t1